jgi:hypothetical protein
MRPPTWVGGREGGGGPAIPILNRRFSDCLCLENFATSPELDQDYLSIAPDPSFLLKIARFWSGNRARSPFTTCTSGDLLPVLTNVRLLCTSTQT